MNKAVKAGIGTAITLAGAVAYHVFVPPHYALPGVVTDINLKTGEWIVQPRVQVDRSTYLNSAFNSKPGEIIPTDDQNGLFLNETLHQQRLIAAQKTGAKDLGTLAADFAVYENVMHNGITIVHPKDHPPGLHYWAAYLVSDGGSPAENLKKLKEKYHIK